MELKLSLFRLPCTPNRLNVMFKTYKYRLNITHFSTHSLPKPSPPGYTRWPGTKVKMPWSG